MKLARLNTILRKHLKHASQPIANVLTQKTCKTKCNIFKQKMHFQLIFCIIYLDEKPLIWKLAHA